MTQKTTSCAISRPLATVILNGCYVEGGITFLYVRRVMFAARIAGASIMYCLYRVLIFKKNAAQSPGARQV